MIVNPTDFHGILSLGANLYTQVANNTTDANISDLQQAINIYESEYLRLLLQPEDLSDFYHFVDGENSVKDWSEVLQILRGDEHLLSPIACYVYFRIVGGINEQVTEIGVVKSADNDTRAPRNKQVRAWNLMVDIHAALLYPKMQELEAVLPGAHEFRKLSILGI